MQIGVELTGFSKNVSRDFTKLKTLNLKETKVTDAGLQALQQALLNVKVER